MNCDIIEIASGKLVNGSLGTAYVIRDDKLEILERVKTNVEINGAGFEM